MSEVITLGETLVSLRSEGPLRFPAQLYASPAGAESNVAIGLARLGHRVSWMSRVSTDAWGDAILAALRGEGVDVSGVVRDNGRPTAFMSLTQRTPEHALAEYRRRGSAGSALCAQDVSGLGDTTFLHLTGITAALSSSAREAVRVAAEHVRERGGSVSLDLNYRRLLWSEEDAGRVLNELVDLVDVLIGGEEELELLTDEPEELLERGPSLVVRKLGSAGAEAWTASGHVHGRGHEVRVVDTVGAGDGFCAGLLSGLLDGLSTQESLARGNRVGAFAVGTRGDWQGYPTRDELDLLSEAESTLR